MVHPLLSDHLANHRGCYIWVVTIVIYALISLFFCKAEKVQQREKNLEEAKKITIKEDPSLPPAKRVSTSLISIFGQVELACHLF